MAESVRETAEFGSQFNSLSSSHPRTQQSPLERGYDSDGSGSGVSNDFEGLWDSAERNSWAAADADEGEEMRKLRERKGASDVNNGLGLGQASPETRSQARAKGKAKAVEEEKQAEDEGEDEVDAEEGDEVSMSEGVEDADADDAEVDEDAEIDVEGNNGELGQDSQADEDEAQDYDSAGDEVPRARKRGKRSLKAIPGDGQDEFESEDEDDDMPASPLKPRLKIKLKLPIVPASSTSNTATPVPEEEKVMQTPSRRAVAKRNAAVRGRRRIQESSEDDIESEDEEAPQSEQEAEEEEEEDMDVDVDVDNTPATTRSQRSNKSRPMTSRQAVLANVVDASHVALDSDLVGQNSVGSSGKSKKKVLNETELALRKEENARKRKNLSEKKLEDEKLETINRLLKKQTRPRQKRAGGPSNSAGSSVPPVAAPSRGKRSTARGGKAKGGARARNRARGEEEGEEGEREDGEGAMDVDGEDAGEGDEGDEDMEGEDEEAFEGSAGGSDGTRGSQGRQVPMLRWISTTYVVSEAPDSGQAASNAEAPAAKPTQEVKDEGDKKDGDVDMADAQATETTQPPVAAEVAEGSTVEKLSSGTAQESLAGSGNRDLAGATQPRPSVNYERRMVNYFAIPSVLLSSSAATTISTTSTSRASPTATAETSAPDLSSTVFQEAPLRPAASTCAVSGCNVARKYRLVKDWTKGACGMEHLKVLEAQLSVQS